jgi:hypothetical protein
MIANIALDDGLILPHSANPAGSNFRERQAEACQKVTSLHVFRYLGELPEAENWHASQRDEAITRFRKTELVARFNQFERI